MKKYPVILLVLLFAAVILFSSCDLRDLSGITKNSKNEWVTVNNRPGSFAVCSPKGDELDCKRLKFNLQTHELLDLEGITYIEDNLYYVAIEKRNNQCLSGCTLSQEVIAFRISASNEVYTDSCGSLKIPLYQNDVEDCSFANCGLEGIAYDKDRNRLYIAKEMVQPRIFMAQLDENKCPTGEYKEVAPPLVMITYNGLAYSSKWQSLFLLSTRRNMFYAWNLTTNSISLKSSQIPKVQEFLETKDLVEGIYVDDESNTVVLLAEDGSFISAELPPVK